MIHQHTIRSSGLRRGVTQRYLARSLTKQVTSCDEITLNNQHNVNCLDPYQIIKNDVQQPEPLKKKNTPQKTKILNTVTNTSTIKASNQSTIYIDQFCFNGVDVDVAATEGAADQSDNRSHMTIMS